MYSVSFRGQEQCSCFVSDDGDDGSRDTCDSLGDHDGGMRMEMMEMKGMVGGGGGAGGGGGESSGDSVGVGDGGGGGAGGGELIFRQNSLVRPYQLINSEIL